METEEALAGPKELRMLFHRMNLDIGEKFLKERIQVTIWHIHTYTQLGRSSYLFLYYAHAFWSTH